MIDPSEYYSNTDPFVYPRNLIQKKREKIEQKLSDMGGSLAEIRTLIGTEDSILNMVVRGEVYSLEEIGEAIYNCTLSFQTIGAKYRSISRLIGYIERNSSTSAAKDERSELDKLHQETRDLESTFRLLRPKLSGTIDNLISDDPAQILGPDYNRVTEAISSPTFDPGEYNELTQILDSALSNVQRLIGYGLNQLAGLEGNIRRDRSALSTKHSRYQTDEKRGERISQQFKANLDSLSRQIAQAEDITDYLEKGGTLYEYGNKIGTCAQIVDSVERMLVSDPWLSQQESDYHSRYEELKASISTLRSQLEGFFQTQDDFERMIKEAPDSIAYWNINEVRGIQHRSERMLENHPWLKKTDSISAYDALCRSIDNYTQRNL